MNTSCARPQERASETSETGVGSEQQERNQNHSRSSTRSKQHPVSVEITAAESLSYAMVHNGFKFVRQIKITNPGTEIRGAVVRVEVFASTGRISEDFQQYVDLAAGQAIVLDDVDVHVSAATMYELSDKQPGRVVVTIESGAAGPAATELGKAEARLQLLPAQLWIAGRGLVSYEFLAAFVQPHHPAISKLVSEAADLLARATGSSSLDGYTDRCRAGGRNRLRAGPGSKQARHPLQHAARQLGRCRASRSALRPRFWKTA